MDKLDKFRNVVEKGDKRNFIDSIYDFSEKEILELSEEEFQEILECCSKIRLDGIEEFFDFLFEEGSNALENSKTVPIKDNALIGRFYFSIFLNLHLKHDLNFAKATMNLGISYSALSEFGIDPKINLEKSIKLQQEARKILPKKSIDYATATMNQGAHHIRLGELGVEPKYNLEEGIKLLRESKKIFEKNNPSYWRATMNQGIAYKDLGELGIEPIKNIEQSIKLQQEARKMFPKNTMDYGHTTINLGYAHLRLALIGINPEKNLVESIKLQQEARRIFLENSTDYAIATMNQGNAHGCLAELGIDQEKNLKEAIKLHEDARRIFPKYSMDYGRTTINLGIAHQRLAERGIDQKKNLEQSIKLLQEAIIALPKNRMDCGRANINLGNSHLELAELGIDPENNLKEAIKLQEEAIRILPKNSIDYGIAHMNLGIAHQSYAERGIEFEKNFNNAEKIYEKCINIFLNSKDGWKYPLAVLNYYMLYRRIFWKTGDKNFLQKANNSLNEAKKNIDAWNVLGKNVILGELCAVEADLHELQDNYFVAGLKYRDAYQLTRIEYFKFMCEFCGAKTSTGLDSFSKLVDKWKNVDKKGIFMDFYNYALYEGHLEEAIKVEALRFAEVRAAKSKLDEIYARTAIYHIKTRVGACIDILNAYLSYFPEKDTEKDAKRAIECIANACEAFKIHGNKPEMNLCNMFSRAIKNNESQMVWLDLIKNHLSNNLSKLIGEAAIIETTKIDAKVVKESLGRIENRLEKIDLKGEFIGKLDKKLDEIIISLKPGISEEITITVGFDVAGTGAQHVITIPLQEISYSDLKNDLEKIKGESIFKLTSLPAKLAQKVRDYLIRNKKDDLLKNAD